MKGSQFLKNEYETLNGDEGSMLAIPVLTPNKVMFSKLDIPNFQNAEISSRPCTYNKTPDPATVLIFVFISCVHEAGMVVMLQTQDSIVTSTA